MFVAELSIAISFTATAVYLMFYPVSEYVHFLLDRLNYMGKLVMVFGYTFCFIGSELVGTYMYFPFMFLVVAFLIANLVLVQYKIGYIISLWSSIVILAAVYSWDFVWTSSPKEKEIFYVPMFIELMILGVCYMMYVFQVPERLCKKVRFFQLFPTGYLFFTIALINFCYEASLILYNTLKLNSGNFNLDTDNWYHFDNIFHKD